MFGCLLFDAGDRFFPAFELLDIVLFLIFACRDARLAGDAFGSGGDFDGELTRILEDLLKQRRRLLPSMIVLSVYEQDRKLVLLVLALSLLFFLIGLVGSQAGDQAAGEQTE